MSYLFCPSPHTSKIEGRYRPRRARVFGLMCYVALGCGTYVGGQSRRKGQCRRECKVAVEHQSNQCRRAKLTLRQTNVQRSAVHRLSTRGGRGTLVPPPLHWSEVSKI